MRIAQGSLADRTWIAQVFAQGLLADRTRIALGVVSKNARPASIHHCWQRPVRIRRSSHTRRLMMEYFYKVHSSVFVFRLVPTFACSSGFLNSPSFGHVLFTAYKSQLR